MVFTFNLEVALVNPMASETNILMVINYHLTNASSSKFLA